LIVCWVVELLEEELLVAVAPGVETLFEEGIDDDWDCCWAAAEELRSMVSLSFLVVCSGCSGW